MNPQPIAKPEGPEPALRPLADRPLPLVPVSEPTLIGLSTGEAKTAARALGYATVLVRPTTSALQPVSPTGILLRSTGTPTNHGKLKDPYVVETYKCRPLTADEQAFLGHYEYYVRVTLAHLSRQGNVIVDHDSAVSDAYLSAIGAVMRYDPEVMKAKGGTFVTFVYRAVMRDFIRSRRAAAADANQPIIQAVEENDEEGTTSKGPIADYMGQMYAVTLPSGLTRTVRASKICKLYGLRLKPVLNLRRVRSHKTVTPLEAAITNAAPPAAVQWCKFKKDVLIRSVPPRTIDMLELKYGIGLPVPLTSRQIGEVLACSDETVRTATNLAVKYAREYVRDKALVLDDVL